MKNVARRSRQKTKIPSMDEGEMDGALSWPARHNSHGRVMRMREKRTRPFDGGACCGGTGGDCGELN